MPTFKNLFSSRKKDSTSNNQSTITTTSTTPFPNSSTLSSNSNSFQLTSKRPPPLTITTNELNNRSKLSQTNSSQTSINSNPTFILPASSNTLNNQAMLPKTNRSSISSHGDRIGTRSGIGGGGNSNYYTRPGHIVATEDVTIDLIENRLSIGIDFGTTFSGVAYSSNRLSGQIRQILNWPGSFETYRKVPTCMLYSQFSPHEEAQILAWGIDAKSSPIREGMFKVEYFKLFLDPNVLRDGRIVSSARLPDLPEGKEPFDIICDFLECLWKYAKEKIIDDMGSVIDLDSAEVILTVPAAWDAAGCAIMREAAIKAGLVYSSRAGDNKWRDRLKIITEPEAAAIHASTLSTLHKLRASQCFIIADLGGGTCDLATYKLIGQLKQLEMAEMCSRSGANCGSLFLDLRFEALIRSILRNHPIHLDPPSIASFVHSFSETDKLNYLGEEDDNTLFRFNCFNIEDDCDASIGLEFGELAIPGYVLRQDVFDPVINQVLDLIEAQIQRTPDSKISAIILVGGFAASQYLFTRANQVFGSRIPVVVRPMDCDVATLQGAARYGLSLTGGRTAAVSSVICPRSYLMKVKIPAEPVDRYQRPGYITTNKAGVEVCENRLSYLCSKGAVLRKGQRLRSRFCKYSKGRSDSLFSSILYVSDADKIYRYADEGEIYELCRWTVDLSALPVFYHNADNNPQGFYTEFNLGLELDSAEVRGVLLNDRGEECGRATIEFIGI